jgi:hypothetical protein
VPLSAVPPESVVALRSGQFSPREGVHALIKASVPDPPTLAETWDNYRQASKELDMGGLKEEPTKVEINAKSDDWGDLSVVDAPSFVTSLADLVWGDQLGEEFETKSWAPTVTLH